MRGWCEQCQMEVLLCCGDLNNNSGEWEGVCKGHCGPHSTIWDGKAVAGGTFERGERGVSMTCRWCGFCEAHCICDWPDERVRCSCSQCQERFREAGACPKCEELS